MAVKGFEPGEDQEDARIARLYREASTEEPPARVHAAVRAAARSAVDRPADKLRSRWTPWRVPFALAAVAVVSASLVTLVMEERREDVVIEPLPAPRDAAQSAPAAAEAPQSAPPAADAPARNVAGDEARAGESRRYAAPRRSASEPPAKRADGAPESKVLSEPAVLQKRQMEESVPAQAPSEAEARPRELRAPAPASADRAATPPAPAAAPAPRAARPERYQMTDEIGGLKAELDSEPPARWLERITTLRREGRKAEADALLAEFKRRYPEERLPASLQ